MRSLRNRSRLISVALALIAGQIGISDVDGEAYANLLHYRQKREWQDEVRRLDDYFAEIRDTLRTHSQQSMGLALIRATDELRKEPHGSRLALRSIAESLKSGEPKVRIAAAQALASPQFHAISRSTRMELLQPNLNDRYSTVRFWTATALEDIGAKSRRGSLEIHHLTLPIFLAIVRSNHPRLRLAALIQLARIAPECIDTNVQVRELPEVRRAFVEACSHQKKEIAVFAKQVVSAFRWQRMAYESQRMRLHYLADTFELECLAAEAMLLKRHFAAPPITISNVLGHTSVLEVGPECGTYMLPIAGDVPIQIAADEEQAQELVKSYLHRTYAPREGLPEWAIESVEPDSKGLYYAVTAWHGDITRGRKMLFIVPRPTMLSKALVHPQSWFPIATPNGPNIWPAKPPSFLLPDADAQIVLGEAARSDRACFTTTSDVFAYFICHFAILIVDREVEETAEALTWRGRFAMSRNHAPRFFEPGGDGSSDPGGGGWDFHHVTIDCNRITGVVTLSAKVIEYEVRPAPDDLRTPSWLVDELRLMGWKPLTSIDYFGGALVPPEYQSAIDDFDPKESDRARQKLYKRWVMEKSLPDPFLVLAILQERAGNRDGAGRMRDLAEHNGSGNPRTLTELARIEVDIGEHSAAERHVEAALQLWPEYGPAKEVLSLLAATPSKN